MRSGRTSQELRDDYQAHIERERVFAVHAGLSRGVKFKNSAETLSHFRETRT